MDRYEWKGDFLGFTLGGTHSSTLGIVRTSDGSRYTDGLVPEFEDKIVKVTGRNDTYYFGSEYKQANFEIPIAFDYLTETQLRQLKKLMNGSGLKDLIFDEAPYKVYKVKCNGTANLTYICFEENYERVYKGEGNLNFVAYFPFARSRYNYMEEYNSHNIPEWRGTEDNKQDWLLASGIPSNTKTYEAQGERTTIRYIEEQGSSTIERTKSSSSGHISKTLEKITENNYNNDNLFLFLKNPGDMKTDIKCTLRTYSTITSSVRFYEVVKSDDENGKVLFTYQPNSIIAIYNENGDIATGTIHDKEFTPSIIDPGKNYSLYYYASYVNLNTSSTYTWKIALKTVAYNNYNSPITLGSFNLTIPQPYHFTDNSRITMDSNNHLLVAYNIYNSSTQQTISRMIINDWITSGDFFGIPLSHDNDYYYLEIVPISQAYNLYFDNVDRYNYLYY